MAIPAVSGGDGEPYNCFANEDIGATATEMVRAIAGHDYEGLRAAVKGNDAEAVSVLLATVLTDVLSDVSAEHAAADRGLDVPTLLLIKMTTVRRGDEIE